MKHSIVYKNKSEYEAFPLLTKNQDQQKEKNER